MIIISADIWFKRDVANALQATAQAGLEIAAQGDGHSQYLVGYRAAISTLALFFGIAPALVLPERGQGPLQIPDNL